MMKKVYVITVVLISLAACRKDESPSLKNSFEEGQKVTISVKTGQDIGTKITSALDGQTVKSVWGEDDSIAVIVGGSASVFHLKDGSGTASATFEGVMPASGNTFDVRYPVKAQSISHQEYVENALPKDVMTDTAANCTLGSGITLKHQYAVLKLNLFGRGQTVGKIVVSSTDPSFSDTLNCGAGVTVSTTGDTTAFLMVTPVGRYGFKVTVFNNNSSPQPLCTFETSRAKTFTADKVLNLPLNLGNLFEKGQKVTISANTGQDIGTKVTSSLDGQAIKSVWDERDSIAVIVGSSASVFHLKDGSGTASATFEGVMPASGNTFDVRYPVKAQSISHQEYVENALPKDVMTDTAANCTLGSEITLKHQYAVLKLNLYGTGQTVGKIVVSGTDPSFSDTLDCGTGVTVNTPDDTKAFLMVTPVGSYNFKTIVFDNSSSPQSICFFETSRAREFTAGEMVSMPANELGYGAFFTEDYTSPFKTVLGKTDAEIQAKLNQLWNHFFIDNTNKIYFDKGSEAYITGGDDVRTEGISYGMMISVQTDHQEQFDKLWTFAKTHMLHTSGDWEGYFAWQCHHDGTVMDPNCAPDGEMYLVMSLLFASHRWGNGGKYDYNKEAQYTLKNCWKNGIGSLFNETYNVITFQPYTCYTFSDPSYDLPAFVELFSRWSDTDRERWKAVVTATRDHLYKSSHATSGLFADYSDFEGIPKKTGFNPNSHRYMYDAMRCAMNFGMDYYLFRNDSVRQKGMARRLIDFFEKDGYTHARFDWDGSNPEESYNTGEIGANAAACYALLSDPAYKDIVKKNLQRAWDNPMLTGQYRYYDGLVHYLSMLHLCGAFRIWKPTQIQSL